MALGERGQQSLLLYGSKDTGPIYDKAHTLGSTYQHGMLRLFTSHMIKPHEPANEPGYAMIQLRVFAITDSAESFRQCAAVYRNAIDWAKEQRDGAIKQANDAESRKSKAAQDEEELQITPS